MHPTPDLLGILAKQESCMIRVEIDDRALPALAELGQRVDDLTPVFRSLGVLEVDSKSQHLTAL